MKKREDVKPNYAPIYAAAMYPDLAAIFIKHGYALAVHGSLAHDFDLIAVPWAKKVSKAEKVIKAVMDFYATGYFHQVDGGVKREHGRVAYSFSIGFGICSLDLSFFP